MASKVQPVEDKVNNQLPNTIPLKMILADVPQGQNCNHFLNRIFSQQDKLTLIKLHSIAKKINKAHCKSTTAVYCKPYSSFTLV